MEKSSIASWWKCSTTLLKTEELHATESFADLSLREVHLIEEVCLAVDHQRDNRATAIAAAQRVTAGTLTTVVNQLEEKRVPGPASGRRGQTGGPPLPDGKRPGGQQTAW